MTVRAVKGEATFVSGEYLGHNGDIDIIYGDESANQINGQDGADIIHAGLEDDAVAGGSGRDLIYGGAGADNLSGGANADVIFGDAGNDSLNGGDGADTLHGGEGADSISGGDDDSCPDTIYGGPGDDNPLNGFEGEDEIYGEEGNDTINGGDQNDRLFGGDGNDTISGGNGDDFIDAGLGLDTVIGGAGNNTVNFGAGDNNADTLRLAVDGFVTLYSYEDGVDILHMPAECTLTNLGGAGDDFVEIVSDKASASSSSLFVGSLSELASYSANHHLLCALDSSSGKMYFKLDAQWQNPPTTDAVHFATIFESGTLFTDFENVKVMGEGVA